MTAPEYRDVPFASVWRGGKFRHPLAAHLVYVSSASVNEVCSLALLAYVIVVEQIAASCFSATFVWLHTSPGALRVALHHARPSPDHEPAVGLLLVATSNTARAWASGRQIASFRKHFR
jgi:hypothetical protein